jgi:hypothetical protein
MTATFTAVYDGEVFRPSIQPHITPNTRVQITIETNETAQKNLSFLETAMNLRLEGPSDWSEKIEEYLYGNGEVNENAVS